MSKEIDTLILAAGFGTRMQERGQGLPKGLIPVGETTIIDKQLENLALISPHTTVLITNAHFYPQFYTWNQGLEHPVILINNGVSHPENRFGALKDAVFAIEKARLGRHDLLILPSDTLFDFALTEFIQFTQKYSNNISTIFRQFENTDQVANRLGCGVIHEDRLIGFYEKPAHPPTSFGAIPIYYYPKLMIPILFNYVDKHNQLEDVDAPGTILPWLINSGHQVYAYIIQSQTLDVGTIEDLAKAENFK